MGASGGSSPGLPGPQSTYATDEGGEIASLRALLDHVELEGLLVQADALHANRPFFSTSRSAVLSHESYRTEGRIQAPIHLLKARDRGAG